MAAPTSNNEVTARRLTRLLTGSDGNGGLWGKVKDNISSSINALDVSSVGGAGKYISAISETDGKISATATTMDTTPTASSTNSVTSGGVKTALDAKANDSDVVHKTGTETISGVKTFSDASSVFSGKCANDANGVPLSSAFGRFRTELGNPTMEERGIIEETFANQLECLPKSKVVYETSPKGTDTWTTLTVSDSNHKLLWGGNVTGGLNISKNVDFRITINSPYYCWLNFLYFYASGNGAMFHIKLEKKLGSSGAWSVESDTASASLGWPGHNTIRHGNLSFGGTYGSVRLTLYMVSTGDIETYPSYNIYKFRYYGGYPYKSDPWIVKNGSTGVTSFPNGISSGVAIPVSSGGTGKTSVTADSYLKGNGTGALVERTYAEVRTDLGISAGANKVEASTTNGKIKIDGTETTVYTHPSQTAQSAKGSATKVPQITTDSTGHVTGITEVTITGVTPASHTHGNIANGGTLTDTAAAAAGNDYVVIRDADNAKIQTSTIKGTDVADAVSKKHSHSTLTLSTTAQAYDGSHTLALPSTDPYTSARTPTSHTHGNIQNGGTLQTTDVTIANGDKLVVTDSSDSSKVARASVSFDGSTTTKALTPNGTFETFAKPSDIPAAVSVKGNAESSYRTGQVNLTPANLGISATTSSVTVGSTTFNKYTHPTTSGNKHVPSGGSSGQFLGWDSDGTAKWVANPNTDTKVKATAKTDNVNYKILATASASPTSENATEAVYDADITLNPSTNTISANVSGNAATATTATKLGSSTLGSGTKPIYLSSGTATECSTYAGGTAVTLNNASKAASTASFYAPTAGGTANYVLIGNGTTSAPTWAEKAPKATTADKAEIAEISDGVAYPIVGSYNSTNTSGSNPSTVTGTNQLKIVSGTKMWFYHDSSNGYLLSIGDPTGDSSNPNPRNGKIRLYNGSNSNYSTIVGNVYAHSVSGSLPILTLPAEGGTLAALSYGNELNLPVSDGNLWINYRNVNNGSDTSQPTISDYWFCNRNGGVSSTIIHAGSYQLSRDKASISYDSTTDAIYFTFN